MSVRAVNIDWLEVYAHEPPMYYPMDADFFMKQGYFVKMRDYGTPVYREMFTLEDAAGYPIFEIRRNPKSSVLHPYSAHIRIPNRCCYFDNAASFMSQFLSFFAYEVKCISRLDICYDFVKFDYGDDPFKFLQRYIRGKYTKINQGDVHAHGQDLWDGRYWNSVSWGSKKSMVSCKMYNKSLELSQGKDKPYIRQAWFKAGLVDDPLLLTKRVDGSDTRPVIWRVEFSMKAVNKWLRLDNFGTGKNKYISVEHKLDMYETRAQLWTMFASLAQHYFHFKHYSPSVNKYTAEDKLLFDFQEASEFYKVSHVASDNPTSKPLARLLRQLRDFQSTAHGSVLASCQTIIEEIERRLRLDDLTTPLSQEELTIIRQLMAIRFKHGTLETSVAQAHVTNLFEAMEQASSSEYFGER